MDAIPITPGHATSTSSVGRLALIARRPLLSYFALAFVGSWLVLLPIVLGQSEHGLGLLPFAVPSGADFALAMLSAYTGPLLAAVLVTRVTQGRKGLRQFRRRITHWRVGIGWYLVALLAVPTIWLASYGLALGGAPLAALARNLMLLLTTFLPFLLLFVFMPSLGEEPGWRGFALPRLQARHGPLVGALVLGTLHALWHLPMFFTPNLGPFTAISFTTFVLGALAVTFIYSWVVNNAGGSVLLAILLHASGNAASGLLNRLIPTDLPPGWTTDLVNSGWVTPIAFVTVAVVLAAATRGRLGYKPESDQLEEPSPS